MDFYQDFHAKEFGNNVNAIAILSSTPCTLGIEKRGREHQMTQFL
jgi:hypothetical protein